MKCLWYYYITNYGLGQTELTRCKSLINKIIINHCLLSVSAERDILLRYFDVMRILRSMYNNKNPIRHYKHILTAALIVISGLIAYGGMVGNDFTYDDHHSIVENEYLGTISFMRYLFSPEYFTVAQENTYRPVVTALNFCEKIIFGDNPSGYHAVNLLLHIVSAILMYFLLFGLGFTRIACIAALFHAIHPVLSESVLSAAFVEDLLCLFFILASLLAIRPFFTNQGVRSYLFLALSSLMILFALGSKEMAFFYPLGFIVLYYDHPQKNKTIAATAFFAVITILFGYISLFLLRNPASAESVTLTSYSEWFTVIYYIPDYIRQYCFPLQLNILPRVKDIPPANMGLIVFYWLSVLALLGGGLYLRTKKKVSGSGILWFIAALIPVSGITPLKFPYAERFIYVPAMGLHIICASLIMFLLEKYGRKYVSVCVLTLVCGALIARSAIRCADWKNDWTLWHATAKTAPYSPVTHYMLGMLYQDNRDLEKACAAYKRSIARNPEYLSPYINLAAVYMDMKQYDNALFTNYQILKKNPNIAVAHMNNAMIFAGRNQPDKEFSSYQLAIQADPNFIPAYQHLAQWYLSKGDIDKAAEYWKKGIDRDPYWTEGYVNLYKFYTDKNQGDNARQLLRRGLHFNPNNKQLRLLQLKSQQ
ncbi:MAG: hypothetical protein C4541_09830 [Candidatus Auribacter fodinae]|uniref:Uncharacterized protein n=1 Tax=Candidatus Auribacter fodinae TaxID=2093366 RepID=A0A3A4QZT8_9BACT|nr:MAG: hypothetical protein C4541_09830 [Candidatus Auribacter fodinae]